MNILDHYMYVFEVIRVKETITCYLFRYASVLV